jgi:endonuclease/exonuclease/phosphatase family metal-dependent hydrolase
VNNAFMRVVQRLGVALLVAIAACSPEPPAEEAAPEDTMRILAYNIHHGEGMDSIVDLQRIADLIAELDVDVVTLQEVDSVTARTGMADQTRILAELTGMDAGFGRFMDYEGGAYGMAVLSRWPIVEGTNWELPEGPEPRSALALKVRSPRSGREAVVVGIHFYGTSDERLEQARVLDGYLRPESAPVILAGDFNSTPGTGVMDYLSINWAIAPKGADHFTFPSYGPDREIDYIVYRPMDAIEVREQTLLDEPVMSDHRPLLATIVLK